MVPVHLENSRNKLLGRVAGVTREGSALSVSRRSRALSGEMRTSVLTCYLVIPDSASLLESLLLLYSCSSPNRFVFECRVNELSKLTFYHKLQWLKKVGVVLTTEHRSQVLAEWVTHTYCGRGIAPSVCHHLWTYIAVLLNVNVTAYGGHCSAFRWEGSDSLRTIWLISLGHDQLFLPL